MTGLVVKLRKPVMLHSNAEQTNAERREAADRIEALEAAVKWIARHYENQDINHVDFRVEAKRLADAALTTERELTGEG